MTTEQLKCDINFPDGLGGYEAPASVVDYIYKNAITYNQYVTYLEDHMGELVFRTWAYRKYTTGIKYVEVERKQLHSEMAVNRNIYFTQMGGYHPVYEPKTCASGNWYGYTYYHFNAENYNTWFCEKPMGLNTVILNSEMIFDMDEYEYCGYTIGDLKEYLLAYEKDHRVEYFGKMGLIYSKLLMNQVKKDKAFIRFLSANVNDINRYGSQAAVYAYKNKVSIEEASEALRFKREAERATKSWGTRIKEVNRVKLYRWINDNGIKPSVYGDYFRAISEMGYDLTDTKNLYPKNFEEMHNIRTDEYASWKAKQDAKQKREFNRKFIEVSKKLKCYELVGDKYTILIPNKAADLVKEGMKLHHCVGRMGYDKKMADGISFIAFIRVNDKVSVPYATVEFGMKEMKILQIHGINNSRPPQDVLDFTDEWAKNVKKRMKSA